ncbi:MAG TPA: phosphoenolpyruvate--protein phosphotransferase [Paenibacillus sp.]|uniref:phosphoenolpyruvate--protein phosphotransferase n=1 Tax=Paenibacillus sp. TaxID=58172 RepID=UPI0028D0471E|nr:phosphoenolpyruvate--protein phosphotransferase [Paenibacillus sp.]HUC92272.1 phosphoenolpyruvate--protein phosphotransferase [Paenibacillus sp.]
MGETAMAELPLQGLGVSKGVRIGEAFVYKPFRFDESAERSTDDPNSELNRLQTAKASCVEELNGLIERAAETLGEEKAGILKGQVGFLNDPAFYPPMEKLIRDGRWNAETAVHRTVKQVAGIFEGMANAYMQERAADVRDVGNRLLRHLSGNNGSRLEDIDKPVIIVADDLSPSDTVQLDKRFVLGFVTRVGGKTSHTAILANSLGIAAVLGLGNSVDRIGHGDRLILDGSTGTCILYPEPATVNRYERQQRQEEEENRALQQYAGKPAVTKDGFRIEVAANIGTPEEAQGLPGKGAEGVGLYRTEFLYMSRSEMPDENTQYEAYKAAVLAMEGRPVVIRTLDIGGDKELPYLSLPHELNPFLGYRAVRLCLDRKDLFVTQLRAIIRASAHGPVHIMFPMISGMGEWREAKALYEEVRAQLVSEGAAAGEGTQVGIMIEIPSAALLADRFAREADFFSIGTNDLVQYTVAVDRMNEKVSYLYDYFHPAVLRLIKNVIDASVKHGKWTGMCGSMAGDPAAAPLLIGFGLHEWSMSPSAIPSIKQKVAGLDKSACEALVERVLDMDTPEEVRQALDAFAANA